MSQDRCQNSYLYYFPGGSWCTYGIRILSLILILALIVIMIIILTKKRIIKNIIIVIIVIKSSNNNIPHGLVLTLQAPICHKWILSEFLRSYGGCFVWASE